MNMANEQIEDEIPDLLDVQDAQAGPSNYDRKKVPITLLTGYLGAGKSTLLEYILSANHGYKIAVCMNDFGDTTDIEAKSLTLSDPNTGDQVSSMLTLPNGCLCCSFKDMGIAAIEEMVASQAGGVDWVLVELTGVADPGKYGFLQTSHAVYHAYEASTAPIAKSFWTNEEMGDLILDGVICVVDSRNLEKQLSEVLPEGEVNQAQKQLASSDVILLNKTDLVDSSQLSRVESVVKSINPTLKLYHTVKSQIDLGHLFNLQAYSSKPIGENTSPSTPQPCDDSNCGHDHSHDTDVEVSGHIHTTRMKTITIPLPTLTPPQYDRLSDFLEILLWQSRIPGIEEGNTEAREEGGVEILRCKGYIALTDGREYILQGVTDLFELKELKTASGVTSSLTQEGTSVDDGKVVFIGKGIGESLKAALLRHLGL